MPLVCASLPFFEVGPNKVFVLLNQHCLAAEGQETINLVDAFELDAKNRLQVFKTFFSLSPQTHSRQYPHELFQYSFGGRNANMVIDFDVMARLSLEDQVRLTFWILRCRSCFCRPCLCEENRVNKADYINPYPMMYAVEDHSLATLEETIQLFPLDQDSSEANNPQKSNMTQAEIWKSSFTLSKYFILLKGFHITVITF